MIVCGKFLGRHVARFSQVVVETKPSELCAHIASIPNCQVVSSQTFCARSGGGTTAIVMPGPSQLSLSMRMSEQYEAAHFLLAESSSQLQASMPRLSYGNSKDQARCQYTALSLEPEVLIVMTFNFCRCRNRCHTGGS
eukprot:SAG31_NODE_4694_length_3028_cov_10.929327_4_plen_138_part_00